MPILALLKLIPLKDWLYGALIAIILAVGTTAWIKHDIHERAIGAAQVEKKDLALHNAAVALNKASENLAEIKEIQIGRTYEKIILRPVPDAPGLVCHNSAPAVEPKSADGGPEDHGTSGQLPGGGFNPSGAILTLLRDDDAQINALIDTVLNLEEELAGVTK